ncbi:TonB-dependent receptor [Chryseobacterium taichungense]|uniref:TonB-dependent receptor n=1 Tax=Chryseobacterium taichungense TaxID=295069 RepID=UPI0028ACA563|nr:Plug domain-containing protein [Chryseobacterium taichungense]
MENNHDIDKAFNEASKNLEEPATFPGFDKVWAKVEERLDKKEEKKRKIIPVWIPYGIAASLLIASGIFYFTDKKQSKQMQQEIIATQTSGKEDVSAGPLLPMQKIDSMVKMNIQNKTLPVPSEKIIAYQSAPKLKTDLPASPISEMSAAAVSHEEAAQVAEQKMMAMDSIRRQNIEEVIAMGIKKEKASMGALASSQKVSSFNTVGDTAESSYPNLAFNLKEKETEVKSYNKVNTKAQKPLAFNPVTETRLAEKADTSMFKLTPGLHTNALSERSNNSISIRGTAQSNQNPMVVIDGKVSDMETFRNLDSKKIEAVTVLKAEQAAPLFSGEKARNGVIVVITKSISKKEKKRLKKLFNEKLLKE